MDSKLHILFLGTEWGSSQEDISTLCRELAIHFAQCPGVKRVSFLVPPGKTAGEAKGEALNYNVHLVQAKDCPGMNKVHSLSFPPDSLGDVDVVIGCGLQLGPQAKCIKDMKQCHWVQFVHESSEELGMFKGIQEYEEKHKQEIELCRMADLVVALGPKLFDSISAPLRPDTTVIELIPGLFEEFAKLTPAQKGTRVHKIFLFGNTDLEDFELKGFDVAAKAVGSMRQKKYELIFVGAPEGKQDEVKELLLQKGIATRQLKVKSFCESQELLSRMFLEADLCIMPSRTEGFGLTALKAMSAGTPILVSGNSGFGQALDEVNFGSSFIVDSDDPEVWRSKMEDVLEKERPQQLEEAAKLRDAYSAKYSWKEDCSKIVERIWGKVQDADVPPEIRARGAEASQAYRMALLEGKVQVRRTRLMLIGQDRAGKTSLKKTLLHLPFNHVEPSTDGVEVDQCKLKIEVDQVKGSNWKLVREQQSTGDQCNREVARQVAQKLLENHDEVDEEMGDASQLPSEQTDMREETPSAPDATEGAPKGGEHIISVDQPNHSDERDVPDRREPTPAGSQMQETIPENIVSLVTTHLKDPDSVAESETNEIVLDVWDFAGQHLYYASHPFFFTPRAIYLLVYNLSKDLNCRAEPCVRQGTHDTVLDNLSNETNLDTLMSWLVSVHSMRRAATKLDEDKASESPEEESPDHESPPVILVGTHADKVRHEDIIKSQELIEKKMARKAYAKHVIGGRFAVDNTRGAGVENLKGKVEEILESEPYMKEWLPLKWFKFEETVKSIDEGGKVHHVTQKKVRELAQSKCFIQDDIQVETMLNFFHDLGVIVMHRNTVVLQSCWLIDLFKKLITIRPHSGQGPKHREFWDKLENEGILHQKLIDRAFRDLAPGENDTKEDMLAMMEEYGLIAKFPLMTKSSEKGARCYFVPAQLKTSPPLSEMKPRKDDPCVLLIHFLHGFVPHGLFPQLVSRLIQWCPKVGCKHQPNLYVNAVCCIVGNEAQFDLILSCSQRFIKVVLRSSLAVAEDLASVIPVTMGTIPKEVHTFLRDTLQCLKQECYWLGSMEYEMGVHCLACQTCGEPCRLHGAVSCPDDDCFHFVMVGNESCPRQPLVCTKTFGDSRRFTVPGLESWYIEEHPKKPLPKNTTDPWISRTSTGNTGRNIDPKILRQLSKKLVGCWKDLGYELGVDESKIQEISMGLDMSSDKAHNMLIAWSEDCPANSKHSILTRALREVNQSCLANDLEAMVGAQELHTEEVSGMKFGIPPRRAGKRKAEHMEEMERRYTNV